MAREFVLATTSVITGTETTRATLLTPTSGTRVRIISISAMTGAASSDNTIEFYFGTGTNIDSDATKAIARGTVSRNITNNTSTNLEKVFPDGLGPLGLVDEVVSTRAEVLEDYTVVLIYREES